MGSKIVVSLLVVVLLMLVVMSTGCCGFFDHQGKTAKEVHREHVQTMRINQQELMRDIDRSMLFDQPSKLTEMHMP